jgi:hypothetical protein
MWVNETFLRNLIMSLRAVAIQGYKCVHNDRTVRDRIGTDGGGVGIYTRNSLRYKIVSQSTEIELKLLFVNVTT